MRRRSATWTACCRPRTSRAPMPSSSVGRPRTIPTHQGFAKEGRAPAVRLRGGLSGAAPGHRGLCAAGHARIRVVHEPRCRGLRHAGQLRRVRAGLRQRGAHARRWCSTIWPGGRRASIHAWPLCRRLSRRPWLHPGGDRVPAGLRRQYPASAAPQDLRGADRQRGQPGLVAGGAQARRGRRPSSIAALRANLLGERVDEAAFRARAMRSGASRRTRIAAAR